jgi:hypothetical protein
MGTMVVEVKAALAVYQVRLRLKASLLLHVLLVPGSSSVLMCLFSRNACHFALCTYYSSRVGGTLK